MGIVINEVEINPANGSEFVEIYNSSSLPVDISGWTITPSATWKQYTIVPNTIIEPQSFLAFTHHSSWFVDFGDIVSLHNLSGELIDQTPKLADQDNDANTWQRNTDGLDTDVMSDWRLKMMTPKSSNGKVVIVEETKYSFIAKIDESEYNFDDSVTIYGSTSESLFQDSFQNVPTPVKISIQGPDYNETLTLNLDRDLNFSTTLNLKKILGFNQGTYDVLISYGNHSVQTEFTLSTEQGSENTETELHNLKVFTDKESYIPGETVIIFGEVDSSLEYAGLDYIILDPNGKQISVGTIFPNSQFSTVHQSGGGQIYPFSTQILMHGVNSVYGTYEIFGTYKAQDPIYRSAGLELNASTTFQLVEDEKDDSEFSLTIDKEIYSVNDVVTVTGRSNHVWTENIELNVQQTGVLSRSADAIKDQYIRPDPFTLKQSVDLNGDGTFELKFKFIEDFDENEDLSRYLGDYRVTVSEYFGSTSIDFKVVDNPESFVDIRTPLGLYMNESEYVLGTAINVYGKILDYEYKAYDNKNNYVKFTITDPNGKPLLTKASSSGYSNEPIFELAYTAIPDVIGNFQISAVLHPLQFDLGKYTVTAIHPNSRVTESLDFEIVSAQSQILPSAETKEPLSFEICSSDRANISEIVKDLKQIGKDDIPPSMESVACDGSDDFKTGEKLVIRGNVALKDVNYLDQSSVRTSGQTQTGSSYTTNFAQAELNYVELSIPYPQTLIISSNFKTIPDEGEDYHGGGGAGGGSGGGVTVGDGSQGTGKKNDKATDSERHTGYHGQAILQEVKKNLIDMKVKAYPDADGYFIAVFDLRAGVFVDGVYKIKANYFGHHSEQNFTVQDNSLKGGLKPEIVLNIPKNEYVPGETVSISGQIKNVYYYDTVSLLVETPNISSTNCLVGMECGLGNSVKKLRVSEGTDGATFYLNYKIPSLDSSVGKYTVTADTHFGQIEKSFFVVSENDLIETITPVESSSPTITKKIIQKFNRIPDDKIPIILTEQTSDDSTLLPRVLQGSLFTSARGEESNVNLRISTPDGQCIIGSSVDCLVTESTRKPGAIYSTVSIDDVNYKIRYSGNDVRLEKFSIVPEDSNSQIDIDNWNVEVIKDEQPTRFYYKVSYVALE